MWLTGFFLALFLTVWATPDKPEKKATRAELLYNSDGTKQLPFDTDGYKGIIYFDSDPSNVLTLAFQLAKGVTGDYGLIALFVVAEKGGLFFTVPLSSSITHVATSVSGSLLDRKVSFTVIGKDPRPEDQGKLPYDPTRDPGTGDQGKLPYDPTRDPGISKMADNPCDGNSMEITVKEAYRTLKKKPGNILKTGVIGPGSQYSQSVNTVADQRTFDEAAYGLYKELGIDPEPLRYPYWNDKRSRRAHFFAIRLISKGPMVIIDDTNVIYPSVGSTRENPLLQTYSPMPEKHKAEFKGTYQPPQLSGPPQS